MMLQRGHDANLTVATLCGAAKATAAAPRLTPRLWLERRWQRTHSRSSCSSMAMSAAGMVDAPIDQQQASQLAGTQQWEDLVLYGTEQHLKQQELIQGLHKLPVLVQQSNRLQQQQQLQCQRQALGDLLSGHNGELLSSISVMSNDSDHHHHQHHDVTRSVKISKAQLMQDIKAAASIHRLKQLHQVSRSDMDVIHCSSMLNKLAHLHQAASGSRQNRQSTLTAAPTVQQSASKRATLQRVHGQQQRQQQGQQHQQHQACSSKLYQLDGRCQSWQVHQLLKVLLDDFMQRLPAARTRQLSSTLWVIAKFSKEAASRGHTQRTAAALLNKLLGPTHAVSPGLSHSHVSSSSDGSVAGVRTVKQGVCRGHFADWLAAGVAPGGPQQRERRSIRLQVQQQQPRQQQPSMLLSRGSSTDVANTVWALGRLTQVFDLQQLLPAGADLHSTISALEQLCCHHLHTQWPDGTFISSCLVGFAHMNQPVPHLFNALVARAGSNYIAALQSQQVVSIAWACAVLGHYDQQLFTRLLWRAVAVRQALLPQGVSLLLWAAGRSQHTADPRAVSQLLQVWKQSGTSQVSGRLAAVRGQHIANLLYGLMRLGQLQQQRLWVMSWLLRLVMQKLDDLQPLGIATVLSAVVHLTREVPAAVAHAAGANHKQLQQQAVAAQAVVHIQQQQCVGNASSSRLTMPCRPAAAAAAAASGSRRLIHGLSSSSTANSHQLVSLFRELSRRIAAQLPHTKPSTLYIIIAALHMAGWYDARLYTKLAAAAAAAAGEAAGGVSSLDQQQNYTVQQLLQLVRVFACYQHPVPALWAAAVPQLVSAPEGDQLQVQQQLLLLTASTGSGCQRDSRALEGLLPLASRALQQQEALSVTQLVQAAAAAGWMARVARQGAGMHATIAAILSSFDKQLLRLVPRLVSAVLSRPETLSVQYLPQLLEVAVSLEHRASCSSGLGNVTTSASARLPDLLGDHQLSFSSSSSSPGADGEHLQPKHHLGHHTVGFKQLQRLAKLALDHIGHWPLSSLVVLMSCHTRRPLFDPVLADAYAEELLLGIEQCSVQTLVQLLQLLASAHQCSQGYSHSQLLAVASRQLHSKLLLACDVQLQDAVEALQQLGQHDSAVHRAAVRLLEVWRR